MESYLMYCVRQRDQASCYVHHGIKITEGAESTLLFQLKLRPSNNARDEFPYHAICFMFVRDTVFNHVAGNTLYTHT